MSNNNNRSSAFDSKIFFHSSIRDSSVVAVLELVAIGNNLSSLFLYPSLFKLSDYLYLLFIFLKQQQRAQSTEKQCSNLE